MKKNLLVSIALLLVATLTLCGVTFAFFSGSNEGGNQNVSITEFKFTRSDRIINNLEVELKNSTKLNFPKISKPAIPNRADYMTQEEYEIAVDKYLIDYNLYVSDGDDIHFNDVASVIEVKISNLSVFDIEYKVEAEITNVVGDSYIDLSQSIEYFVFSSDNTKILTDTNNPLFENYAQMLYDLTSQVDDTATLPNGVTMPQNPTLREKNEFRLAAAKFNEIKVLSTVKKVQADIVDTSEAIIILWVNYDKLMDNVADPSMFLKGKVNINIAVTAYNKAN